MNFQLLIESRISKFKTNYGRRFTPEQLDIITKDVKGKFLEWVGKNLDGINFNEKFNKLSSLLSRFDKISSNLPIKDLYGYKNIEQLENALTEYENKQRRNVQKIKDANLVYDDKTRFIVFNPLTHDSSCYYGSGTKWCTASSTDEHFHRYNKDGKLFYVIDRTKKSTDPNYKVAILQKYNGGVMVFNAVDDNIDTGWIFNTDDYERILDSIDSYMNREFSDLIEIYRDERKLKREQERLNLLEKQRVLTQRMEKVRQRRANGEWNLDADCPLIGLKAHAVLRFIKEEDGDKIELPEGFDVYYLYPTGNYYEMTIFKILGLDEYENWHWMVGTEEETHDSMMENLRELYSDIGLKSLSPGFLVQHIDEYAIKEYAEEIYEDWVRSSPESYLTDEDKELSKSQINKIKENQEMINRYERDMRELRSRYTSDNMERLSAKVEELYNIVDELNVEIKYIMANPEGDYSEDKIVREIGYLVRDATENPLAFIDNYQLELEDFLDEESVYKSIIHHDGYDSLNYYDGHMEEIRVNNTYFFVGRGEM